MIIMNKIFNPEAFPSRHNCKLIFYIAVHVN